MSASPLRPKFSLGALAVGTGPRIIAFQYNPEQLTRRVEPQMVGGQSDHAYAVRFVGAPKETLDLQLRFDAIDGLERNDPVALRLGVGSRLSQLELLAYPDLSAFRARSALLDQGIIEVAPDPAPQLLLLLGGNRSWPVRIEQLSISEQQFDGSMYPIRATVDVTMHVLTYSDVLPANPAFGQFLAYQQALIEYAAAT